MKPTATVNGRYATGTCPTIFSTTAYRLLRRQAAAAAKSPAAPNSTRVPGSGTADNAAGYPVLPVAAAASGETGGVVNNASPAALPTAKLVPSASASLFVSNNVPPSTVVPPV